MNKHLISYYRKKYNSTLLIMAIAISVMISLIAFMIDLWLYPMNVALWSGILTLILGGIIVFMQWKDQNATVSNLHKLNAELEYSLELFDSNRKELNGLEELQLAKVDSRLTKDLKFDSPYSHLSKLLLLGVLSIFITMGFSWMIALNGSSNNVEKTSVINDDNLIQESIIPDSAFIKNMIITVTPPAYTKLKSRSTKNLNIDVSEGSTIQWKFEPSGPLSSVNFSFGQEESIKVVDGLSKTFYDSEFYHYTVVDSTGKRTTSEYYSIAIKEDEIPKSEIKGIPEYQRLSWKENYDIKFNIALADDYGLEDAFLSATVAKGSGESVKFREKHFPLQDFKVGKKAYQGSFMFSTAELDLEPGSELYFYVMVKDNCPFRTQATKSLTHFVILEDTVTYEYVDDSGMQVDLMPDFFRSQRQIIIDTERLIKDKASISVDEFKKRSNELGFDQKMLRLKYGQFLGEEDESGIAIENEIETDDHEDHDHGEGGFGDPEEQRIADWSQEVLNRFGHNHDHEAEANQRLETAGTEAEDPSRPDWVQELSHNHDNAEVNTYLDMPIKSKLKAVLSVMWDSELHLRLYDPVSSLPFQYEALKYLEEIKNHARVYVHRIGFDPPVFKEAEKRLTGDLSEINDPLVNDKVAYERTFAAVRSFLNQMDLPKGQEWYELTATEKSQLSALGNELATLATDQLEILPILSEVSFLLNQNDAVEAQRIHQLKASLLKVLPADEPVIKSRKIERHPLMLSALQGLNKAR